MKSLAAAIALFYFASTMAAAPYGIKGQQQTSTLYSNVHQFPNNQVTNMGGIDAVVETGNSNILSNPSFEHLTVSSGWVDNGTDTGIATAVAVIAGKKAIGFLPVARSINLTQSSTLYANQFADGVQGLAMVRIKSDVAVKVCSIQAGTVSTTNCVTTNTDLKWGLYKVPFILGGTSNGISISTNGTLVTGTVIVDDAFVGAQDLTQNITACNSVDCETDFSINVSATGVVTEETGGDWISSCTNATTPICTFNAGIFTASPHCWSVPGIAGFTGYENIVSATQVSIYTISNSAVAVAGARKYFCKKQGADYTTAMSRSSGNTYSSNNADTDWRDCGLTGSAFTGFGASVPTPTLQCKRQGSDLLMKGKFVAGTGTTAVEARMALPVWNGIQLTSASSSVIPNLQIAGILGSSVTATTYFSLLTLIEPSVSYITFGAQQSTTSAISKAVGNSIAATGTTLSITARIPIEGWNNSNIIIGSFNGLQTCVDTKSCTDTFSAYVSAAGVVSNENTDWINGSCSVSGTSIYACTFNTSIFTVAPNCVVNPVVAGHLNFGSIDNVTSTIATYRMNNYTGIAQARDAMIICQKQGADYIGKTAMAVASDQNLRTPGLTNGIVLSATVGSTSSTSCTASPCAYVDQTGGYISSVTRSSVGNYVMNFNKTFTSLKCSHSQITGAVAGVVLGAACINCNSIAIAARTFVPAAQDAGWDTICTGY